MMVALSNANQLIDTYKVSSYLHSLKIVQLVSS